MTSKTSADDSVPSDQKNDPDSTERQNILTLVAHQVLFRTAWIFKTESVIMPAFLDSITDEGWVRGMLPPLNRFGQSLTPLMLADRLRHAPVKGSWLQRTTLMMSLPFLLLGVTQLIPLWSGRVGYVWLFLAAYLVFFCIHGVNQTAFNTVQGKLINPARRGRLMILAANIGTPLAISLALLLLKPWTMSSPPAFARIFLFTGATFFVAGLISSGLRELPDSSAGLPPFRVRDRFRDAWHALRDDPGLRRICLIAAMIVTAQLLFPHYQRLGRQCTGYEGTMLMVWVVAQHIAVAVFSWFSGRLADSNGTRSALRWLVFLAVFSPPIALILSRFFSAEWYWITFFWLGAVPVTYRMMLNYSLELTDRSRHPVYVSTVVLSMAPPIIFLPLIGAFIERYHYHIPFLVISAIIGAAWLLTLTMVEPRHQKSHHPTQPVPD